jgi:hypothetical protein
MPTEYERKLKTKMYRECSEYVPRYIERMNAEADVDTKSIWQRQIDWMNTVLSQVLSEAQANGWDLNTTENLDDIPSMAEIITIYT